MHVAIEKRLSPVLRVENLWVRNCSDSQILENVSFEIASGEVLGLLGESGCGKTTTALALLNLLPKGWKISSGNIEFGPHQIRHLSERKMRSIRGREVSIIFQEPGLALNPVMRVGTQITEVMRAHLDWDHKRRKQESYRLLSELGFRDEERIFHAYPHQLSGGQCQRIVTAQAIACRPKLLIADEPTASLDVTTQAEIMGLLSRLRREYGLAMLFISHDPALMAGIADRVLVMQDGRVVEQGPTQVVLSSPVHSFTQAIMKSAARRAAAVSA